MKNEHLVPQIIIDLAQKVKDKNIKHNEKFNYIVRLETIREYCNTVLNDTSISKSVIK